MSAKRRAAEYTLLLFFLLSIFNAQAQTESYQLEDTTGRGIVRIDTIVIDGNRRTKPQVILREITFAAGDTIAFDELMEKWK